MKFYTMLPITIAALIATPTILAAPIAGTISAPAAALNKRQGGLLGTRGLLGDGQGTTALQKRDIEVELPLDITLEIDKRDIEVELPLDITLETDKRDIEIELPLDITLETDKRDIEIELPLDITLETDKRDLYF